MKKTKIALWNIVICGLIILFCAKNSFATPYGTYIGTGTTNDNVNAVLVNELIDVYDLINDPDVPAPVTYFTKYEVVFDGATNSSYWEDGIDGGFTVDFLTYNDDGEPISGTWASIAITSLYYSIKAGTSFDLYYVDTLTLGADNIWDTIDIDNKGLAQLTFWTPNSTPVPEPSTMLLFGAGLAGVAGLVRKTIQRVEQANQQYLYSLHNKRG